MPVGTVIKDKAPLYPKYVPPDLPFRENQIQRTRRLMAYFAEQGTEESILTIHMGPTGTGKTAVARWLAREADRHVQRGDWEYVKIVYLQARSESPVGFLKRVVRQITGDHQRRKGVSASDLLMDIEDFTESTPLIVLLDEVDKLRGVTDSPMRTPGDLLKSLADIPGVMVVAITNVPSFFHSLPDELRTRVSSVVTYPPYDHDQLVEILRKRAEMALNPGAWDESVLYYIAQVVAFSPIPSAKFAIQLLRESALLAEERGERLVASHAAEAKSRLDREELQNIISRLSPRALLVLKAITLAAREDGSEGSIPLNLVRDRLASLIRLRRYPLTLAGRNEFYRILGELRREGVLDFQKPRGRRDGVILLQLDVAPLEMVVDDELEARAGQLSFYF